MNDNIKNTADQTTQFGNAVNAQSAQIVEQTARNQIAPGIAQMAEQATLANASSIVANVVNEAIIEGTTKGLNQLNKQLGDLQQLVANNFASNVIQTQKNFSINNQVNLPALDIQCKSLKEAIAEQTGEESGLSLAYTDDIKRIEASETTEEDLPDVSW